MFGRAKRRTLNVKRIFRADTMLHHSAQILKHHLTTEFGPLILSERRLQRR